MATTVRPYTSATTTIVSGALLFLNGEGGAYVVASGWGETYEITGPRVIGPYPVDVQCHVTAGQSSAYYTTISSPEGTPAGEANHEVAPTEGGLVTVLQNGLSGVTSMWPEANITNLTIMLPAEGVARFNQNRSVFCSKNVANLTIIGANTLLNPPTSIDAGSTFTLKYLMRNVTWTRLI